MLKINRRNMEIISFFPVKLVLEATVRYIIKRKKLFESCICGYFIPLLTFELPWIFSFYSPSSLKLEHFLIIKNQLTDKRKMLQLSFGNEFSYYMHINSSQEETYLFQDFF